MKGNFSSWFVTHPKITWSLVFLYMLIIFILSSFPYIEQPIRVYYVYNFIITFIEHVIEYSILGLLLFFGFLSRNIDNNGKTLNIALLAILVSTIYGITDEIHQIFVPGRNCDIIDVIADLIGSCIGVFIGKLLSNQIQTQFPCKFNCLSEFIHV